MLDSVHIKPSQTYYETVKLHCIECLDYIVIMQSHIRTFVQESLREKTIIASCCCCFSLLLHSWIDLLLFFSFATFVHWFVVILPLCYIFYNCPLICCYCSILLHLCIDLLLFFSFATFVNWFVVILPICYICALIFVKTWMLRNCCYAVLSMSEQNKSKYYRRQSDGCYYVISEGNKREFSKT